MAEHTPVETEEEPEYEYGSETDREIERIIIEGRINAPLGTTECVCETCTHQRGIIARQGAYVALAQRVGREPASIVAEYIW